MVHVRAGIRLQQSKLKSVTLAGGACVCLKLCSQMLLCTHCSWLFLSCGEMHERLSTRKHWRSMVFGAIDCVAVVLPTPVAVLERQLPPALSAVSRLPHPIGRVCHRRACPWCQLMQSRALLSVAAENELVPPIDVRLVATGRGVVG